MQTMLRFWIITNTMIVLLSTSNLFSPVLYSLPVGALLAETTAMFLYFLQYHTFLFQLLMDATGAVVFFLLFFRRVKRKWLYILSCIISTSAFYLIFPW